ncbi:MAG: tetratricopeptide repeat protein [Candidatus Obscuribacterales bacterium]|nr:tetratricopeptide repeat protein [Candidatus Obscuribacterales bacterium]
MNAQIIRRLLTLYLASGLASSVVAIANPAPESNDKKNETKVEKKSPPDSWKEYLDLAKQNYKTGKIEDALTQLDFALAESETLKEGGRAEAFCQIADLYISIGSFEKSQKLLETATKDRRELRHDKRLLANALDNLANIYTQKGQFEEAEKLQKEASVLYLEEKDQGGKDYAIFLANCANTARKQKHYPEAKKLLAEALNIHEKLEGKDSLAAGSIYMNLAGLLSDQGQLDKAARSLACAEKILKSKVQSDHPLYKLCLRNERTLQQKRVDLLLKKNNDPYSPQLARELTVLAQKYEQEDDSTKAAAAYKQVLNIQTKILGENDAQLISTMQAYVNCLKKLGADQEAASLQEKVQALKAGSLQ